MIQEGTSLIRRDAVESDDLEWLERVRYKSFIRFFPDLASQIMQAGEIGKYPKGAKLCLANTKINFICIPLNGRLNLKLSAGKIADEQVLSGVDPYETLAFNEVIEGKIFPFAVETDSPNTYIFTIQRVDLIRVFQTNEDIDFMKRLVSSKSVYRFCNWLLDEDVPVTIIRQLLKSSFENLSFEKFRPVQLQHRALVFIEDGLVQALSSQHDQDMRCLLSHGDWFGGSAFDDKPTTNYNFSVLEDTSASILSYEQLSKLLPPGTIKKIVREPCIMQYFGAKQGAAEVSEIGGEKVDTSYKKLGWDIVSERLHQSSDPAMFASVTVWNLLQFMDFEINEKQVQSIVFAKATMNLGACAQVLEDLGFIAKVVKVPGDLNYKLKYPLLHFGFGRPVLILKFHGNDVIYLDPERGQLQTNRSIFKNKSSNYFLQIEESHSKQALKDQLMVLAAKPEVAGRLLLRYFLSLSKKEVRNIFIFRLFQSLAVIMVPSYLLGLINQVVGFKKFDHMPIYYIGLGIFILFQTVAIFMNNYFSNKVLANFKSVVQPYFYRLFLNQPNNFVTSIKAGFIQSRLQLIDYAMAGVKTNRIDFVQYISTLVLFLCIVGYYSWQASVVLLAFCITGAFMVAYSRKNGGLDEINTAQQRQEVLDFGLDFLNGLESIKLSRSEKWSRDRFEKIFLQLSKGSAAYSKSMMFFSQIGTLIFQIGSTIALFVVINEFLTATTLPQNAFAVSMYLSYCLGPYTGILNVFFNYNLKGLFPVAGQMIRAEAKDRFKSLKVISLRGSLRFERVSFRYSERHPFVINDVSFSAKEGEVIAIVGRSGSGKTTLARLIARQMEISGGKILFDETDARLIDPVCLQSQIGFVSQTPTLFSGSIAQNISLSDDILDSDMIVEAAAAANAEIFIEKLPGGYNYRLKEGGRGLSGGERQQIAMARIIYSKPHILVLDEATAHMDPRAERIISDKLMAYHGKKTVFVVVQKISTARRADKIIVMKSGRIVEVGEHNKLLALNGEYAELYRHQVGDE